MTDILRCARCATYPGGTEWFEHIPGEGGVRCSLCGGTGIDPNNLHPAYDPYMEPIQTGELPCPACTTPETLEPLSAEAEAALAAFAAEFGF